MRYTVMDRLTYLIIFLNLNNFISTSYIKNNPDRNIVNKGVWYKKEAERGKSDFIFGGDSGDLDNVVQHNFDAFGENYMQSPFFSNYVERNKRSPNNNRETRKNLNKCKDKPNCVDENRSSIIKSKLLSTLKPASVFNDYPFEVAVLLNNKKDVNNNTNPNTEKYSNTKDFHDHKFVDIKRNTVDLSKDSYITVTEERDKINAVDKFYVSTEKPVLNQSLITPVQNTKKRDFESKLVKKIEIVEEFNNTKNHRSTKNRNVFDKDDMAWHNSAPGPNVNVYKVLPKSKDKINSKINERGLIKVLTMLTKTFKKIMKQHNDIKIIHNKLYSLNDDFVKNVELLTKKFENFNKKYSEMIKVSQELNRMEAKLRDKEIRFENREKELSKNLMEFENQQRKFLSQQRQFYNVQKVMLEQNEKINLKQNIITKTQSEISHRQNNFARILKKAKQIYMDTKKLGTAVIGPKIQMIKDTKTTTPITTESIKINLFSIPTEKRIQNQDQLILEEKDSQPVDDLVYKYYFNNTFIDDIMRNKILATFIASESTNKNGTKNKRNEIKLKSTVLYPVNKIKKIRDKRWIKNIKNPHKKEIKQTIKKTANNSNVKANVIDTTDLKHSKGKNDPFMIMALSFCEEIGQNSNAQNMNWCIEKTIRRLQAIDFKKPPSILQKEQEEATILLNLSTYGTTKAFLLSSPEYQTMSSVTTEASPASNIFFPDNDELENKLKEYELKPDTEGTVYYDGSLHSSDIGHIVDVDSEGFSDIMPGLDSDSRIQVDPLALDFQAKRRADVRRINARIMRTRMV